MRTIFNTDRPAPSRARIASSEYAIVTIGGRSELGQSVRGQYSRQIREIFELGNAGVMWVAGNESGTLSFQRLVGAGGFFNNWQGDECGILSPVSIDLGGGRCVAVASGGLRFEGAMIESVDFGMQAGQLEISEGISLRVASMYRA